MADALHHAHGVPLFHRDIKADNVLFDRRGTVLLADFGIAKLADATSTATGHVSATILYAPPEILDGAAPSAATDIYSLGATLYHAAAGVPAFWDDGISTMALIARIASSPPDPAPLTSVGVPVGMATTLLRCLAKSPGERPISAFDLGVALARDAGETDPGLAGVPDGDAAAEAHRTVSVGPPPPGEIAAYVRSGIAERMLLLLRQTVVAPHRELARVGDADLSVVESVLAELVSKGYCERDANLAWLTEHGERIVLASPSNLPAAAGTAPDLDNEDPLVDMVMRYRDEDDEAQCPRGK